MLSFFLSAFCGLMYYQNTVISRNFEKAYREYDVVNLRSTCVNLNVAYYIISVFFNFSMSLDTTNGRRIQDMYDLC